MLHVDVDGVDEGNVDGRWDVGAVDFYLGLEFGHVESSQVR